MSSVCVHSQYTQNDKKKRRGGGGQDEKRLRMKIRLFPPIEHEIFNSFGLFFARSFAIATLIYSPLNSIHSQKVSRDLSQLFNLLHLMGLRGLTRFSSRDPFIAREIQRMSWTAVIGKFCLPMAGRTTHRHKKKLSQLASPSNFLEKNFPAFHRATFQLEKEIINN